MFVLRTDVLSQKNSGDRRLSSNLNGRGEIHEIIVVFELVALLDRKLAVLQTQHHSQGRDVSSILAAVSLHLDFVILPIGPPV